MDKRALFQKEDGPRSRAGSASTAAGFRKFPPHPMLHFFSRPPLSENESSSHSGAALPFISQDLVRESASTNWPSPYLKSVAFARLKNMSQRRRRQRKCSFVLRVCGKKGRKVVLASHN